MMNMFTMREPELITTAEVAGILGVVPDYVRMLARRGHLPVVLTVGRGQRLFDRGTIEEIAKARTARR